jgi:hypothetical protein
MMVQIVRFLCAFSPYNELSLAVLRVTQRAVVSSALVRVRVRVECAVQHVMIVSNYHLFQMSRGPIIYMILFDKLQC